MRLFKLTLLISILFFSCKNEANKTDLKTPRETKTEVTKTKQKICKVIVKGIFPVDDVIDLFFAEIATDKFNGKKKIKRRSKGSVNSQIITFDLLDFYPEKIRLDLGRNTKMKEVFIEEIIINYDGEIFKVDNTNINEYFTKNTHITFGADNIMNLLELEKDGVKTYDPFLISSPLLVKELVRL